jgi:hypothetical protein
MKTETDKNVKVITVSGNSSEASESESEVASIKSLTKENIKKDLEKKDVAKKDLAEDFELKNSDDEDEDETSSGTSEGTSSKGSSKGSSKASSKSSSEADSDEDCSTTELLASDPLYFVLSRFFITEDGKSLVTVMNDINNKLGKITKILSKKT